MIQAAIGLLGKWQYFASALIDVGNFRCSMFEVVVFKIAKFR